MRCRVSNPQDCIPEDWMAFLVDVVKELRPGARAGCDGEGVDFVAPHLVLGGECGGKGDEGDETEGGCPVPVVRAE